MPPVTVGNRIGVLPWINRRFLSRVKPAAEIGECSPAREQRKLAAIVAADVVDHSRLMGRHGKTVTCCECCEPSVSSFSPRLVEVFAIHSCYDFG